MQNIFIVGLGLIGGSLASNLKYYHKDVTIAAFDANPNQLERAGSIGIIDKAIQNYEDGVVDADIIIYATPVQTTIKYLENIHTLKTKPGVIITDTGSTKLSIQKFESALLDHNIHLIGGHPMAGSHKSGVLNSKKHLFENAYYILVYQLPENRPAYERILQLLSCTQAKFINLTADEHDFITSIVSHVPHILASHLVQLNAKHNNHNALIKTLSAGGFRDITRIASSSPDMWKDISFENKTHIINVLEELQQQIALTIDALESDQHSQVFNLFKEAKDYRDDLPMNRQGAVLSTFDLYVDIPDEAGMISTITTILSNHRISISNLKILEIREDIYGALVISFKSASDREKAIVALSDFNTYLP
ncbi:prephenate dehydrogenase [Staphylococcus canis]|uniref:Prephenate dehydrogenase n=1 Tax=Staphylococcus canis TaxID=2724942 RepID=A0ABS0TCG3_9STAP|nr:prephenate dehydrogenase [Staphylococcus canis]MBI5975433.1 prephenate dehydrogenase [Staphylococcus canis]